MNKIKSILSKSFILTTIFILIVTLVPFALQITTPSTVKAAWLTGYSNRKLLEITAGSPSAQGDTWESATATKDGRIVENNPTTNCGSETNFVTRPDTGSSNEQRSLLEFDCSNFAPPSGYTISSATLNIYYTGYSYNDPVGNTVRYYKLRRSDWSESQATWNIYKTGSNWGTAGASNTSTDIDTSFTDTDTVPASAGWMSWDLGDESSGMLKDAIDNESGILRFRLDQTDGAALEIPTFASSENATVGNRPYISITWANTPSVPSNYQVYVNVYAGEPSVEEGSWTVNSKTYNYRTLFTIHTNDALSAAYPIKIIVDTEELVTGGFFASSASSNAKSVEWVDNSSNTMYYWCTEAGAATPDNFNTSSTIYYVNLPSGLSADTDYTMYLYVDPDQTGASSNYSASDTFSYFEHFDTDEANLAGFLTDYTDWSTDPNAAVVTVSSSVITLDSSNAGQWDGLICDGFGIDDFRFLARVTEYGGTTVIGMFDAGGLGGGDKDGYLYFDNDTTAQFLKYKSNAQASIVSNEATAPKLIELSKFEGTYQTCVQQDSADGLPDRQGHVGTIDISCTDVTHYPVIASYGTNDIDVDWIAVMPEIESPPYVVFPDITYSRNGSVFLNNNSDHWPYDTAFTDGDGETQLYWWDDPLTELTKQPGSSMQVAIKVTDSLASNQNIYVYYGNASQSSFDAYNDPDNTFDEFDDMTAVADWTVKAGSWSATNVIEPILMKGDVGNVGGDAGRLWARMPCVVKVGTGDYKMLFTNALWEKSGSGWPLPYRVYIAESTTPNGDFGSGSLAFTIPEWEHDPIGYFPQCAKKIGSTYYILVTDTDGFKLVYTTDFSTYTVVDNDDSTGKFITSSWLDANSSLTPSSAAAHTLAYDGATYYVITCGMAGNDRYACFSYTTDDPEDWDSTSFTFGAIIIDGGAGNRLEDCDIVTDGSDWIFACTSTNSPVLRYYYCADADFDTGMVAGDWSSGGSLNQVEPTYTGQITSPRLLDDGSDWYLYFASHGIDEGGGGLTERWHPNWISCNHATSFPDTWEAQNTDSKYKQATTTGVQKAYLTSSDEYDCEIITELQTGSSESNNAVGIIFRYNATDDDGYLAAVNYNSGDPIVTLNRIDSGSLTALGSSYDIPLYPTPAFGIGQVWRLRVQLYGENIKVAYSAWGNEWVETHDEDDNTYFSGLVGVATNASEGYFNNFRIRPYSDTEPAVGEGIGDELYISVSPSSFDFGELLQLTSESTGLDYFTLTNESSITSIDVTISGEDMTGVAKTWTLSDTATAGDSTIGMKAGLYGDDYNIIIKKTATFNYLKQALLPDTTQDFGIKIWAPTVNTGSVEMGGDITLTASLAT